MRRAFEFAFCAGLCIAACCATVLARPFGFDDYYHIVNLSTPRISPDGGTVALIISRVNAQKDEYARDLVVVDVRTGDKRVLRHAGDDLGDPQWSPDGKQISFVDASDKSEGAKPQVWAMPAGAGTAHILTQAKNGVEEYAWRPDGSAIAYIARDDPANDALLKAHEDLLTVVDDSFMTRSVPPPAHIWLQHIGGKSERLSEGTWSIYPETLSWSADGRYIAFDRLPGPRFDDILRSRVAVLDTSNGRVTLLANSWSTLPTFSPHGDTLAFGDSRDHTIITQEDLAIRSVDGGPTDDLTALDRDVGFAAWMPDGKSLAVAADDRARRALWIVRGNQAQKIDLGTANFSDGSVARDGAIAFVASTPVNPGELYYLAPGASAPKILTTVNRDISALDLAPSREFSWRNDGFTEFGALTYPLGYRAGKKYPLVLVIHGGPTGEASTTSFDPLAQILAAHGTFVLQPNYRGSDDFGFAYAHAIVGNQPPAGAGSDCVAAVNALVAAGMIDPSRIGVSGWSAGGWLTSWLVTHYDLWKAAVSGAGLDDAVLQYSLSEIDSYMPYLFNGLTPWVGNGMDAYRASSPITYAANAKAATLVLSDTGDPRVPTPESYEFYTALRDLGKPVKFIAIPANGHHPSDPVRRRAVDRVWANWMIEHLPLP